MNGEDKRGIFFGVVGVLTLIVAIIGASLAYFSINANSKEDAITVQAASVQIVYEDGDGINVEELIPSTKAVALKALDRYLKGEKKNAGTEEETPYTECKDDNNNTVCAVYEFTLTNKGENPVDLNAYIVPKAIPNGEDGKPLYNAFRNLKYTLYDITGATVGDNEEGRKVQLDEDKASTATGIKTFEVSEGVTDGVVGYTRFDITGEKIELPGNNTTKQYRLFIWLDEQFDQQGNNIAQDYEQGAQFYGQVFIDVAGEGENNGQLTGTIN